MFLETVTATWARCRRRWRRRQKSCRRRHISHGLQPAGQATRRIIDRQPSVVAETRRLDRSTARHHTVQRLTQSPPHSDRWQLWLITHLHQSSPAAHLAYTWTLAATMAYQSIAIHCALIRVSCSAAKRICHHAHRRLEAVIKIACKLCSIRMTNTHAELTIINRVSQNKILHRKTAIQLSHRNFFKFTHMLWLAIFCVHFAKFPSDVFVLHKAISR